MEPKSGMCWSIETHILAPRLDNSEDPIQAQNSLWDPWRPLLVAVQLLPLANPDSFTPSWFWSCEHSPISFFHTNCLLRVHFQRTHLIILLRTSNFRIIFWMVSRRRSQTSDKSYSGAKLPYPVLIAITIWLKAEIKITVKLEQNCGQNYMNWSFHYVSRAS